VVVGLVRLEVILCGDGNDLTPVSGQLGVQYRAHICRSIIKMGISESLVILLLILLGLVSFRIALNIIQCTLHADFGQVTSVPYYDYEQYDKVLCLHSHRLAIYTVFAYFIDRIFVASGFSRLLLLPPLLYIVWAKDVALQGFKVCLLDVILMTKKDVEIGANIFADTLTSYSRLLPAVYGVILGPQRHDHIVSAILVSIPFWIRMRQCLQEFFYSRSDDGKKSGSHQSIRSIVNALRYALNFPVIALALYPEYQWAWRLLTIILTIANFAWDYFMDWNSSLFGHLETSILVFTILVRVMWVVRVYFPLMYENRLPHYSLIGLEIGRRMAWLVLRVQALAAVGT
jgi:hypothetical protein